GGRERTQDAVLVERRRALELGRDRLLVRFALLRALARREVRIERRVEVTDERRAELRMPREHLLHVRQANRPAGLCEIPAVRAYEHRIAPAEPRDDHE